MVTRDELSESRFTKAKWDIIESGAPVYVSDLEIDGNDCIEAGLGGEEIGTFLEEMLDMCLQNPSLNNKTWLMERATARAERAKATKAEAK